MVGDDVKGTGMKHIAVTHERLTAAISKGVEAAQNVNFHEVIKENMESVTVQTALIRKIHFGTNQAEIQLDNTESEIVNAYFNYPFLNDNMIITCIPEGDVVETDEESYIVPNELYCNVIKYNSESTDLKYLIIGFCNVKGETIANECFDGDLLLQVGSNRIIINEDEIQVNCNDLIINGLSFNKLIKE